SEVANTDQCGECRIQADPKKYTTQLSLDPNTAHKSLTLSEENRRARRWTDQPAVQLPERFDFWSQVLCVEGLRRRCYWETELTGTVMVGAAYGRIGRKGEGHDCRLGRNDSSWGVSCTDACYNAWHNGANVPVPVTPTSNRVGTAYGRIGRKGEGHDCRLGRNDSSWGVSYTDACYNAWHKGANVPVPVTPTSNRVGVYLDWWAGTLAFYRVSSGELTPLHTFKATFTEPLYPAFRLGWVDATVHLC
ncbi:hypothetical protein NHX12_024447, partial [Muraenolepis orangiensis]